MIALKDNIRTPIDDYLERQQLVTPVARFAEDKYYGRLPAMEPYYRDLIPLSKPGPGEQYAFEVDLDQCTGCKACVAACHSLNGLEPTESWRDVGLIISKDVAQPFQQTVTTACHHCADPGCLNGCPVAAYEKDAETGIVHHLDDQCIGCEYCVMKCPYDVPKYSKSKGIVRKCDMCHNRLADGEAPACVQACPTHAIKITTVKVTETTEAARKTDAFLPGAPGSAYTVPTTRYVSKHEVPQTLVAADQQELKLEPAHWPLVIMLTYTQISVGLMGAAAFINVEMPRAVLVALSALFGFTGLTAAAFHLGQPLKAWRFFLGLKTSWLSREILVFILYSGTLKLAIASAILPALPGVDFALSPTLSSYAGIACALAFSLGLVGIFTSAMIYIDTHRSFWQMPSTLTKFYGTAVFALAVGASIATESTGFMVLASIVFLGRIASEAIPLKHATDASYTSAKRTALLIRKRLWTPFMFAMSGLSIATLTPMASMQISWVITAIIAAAALTVGEVAFRYIYFRAVVALKMPGGITRHDSHS